MVLNLFHKIKNYLENFINQLSENFKKEKIYSSSKDNIWSTDLADMESVIKFNKGFRVLLCV